MTSQPKVVIKEDKNMEVKTVKRFPILTVIMSY